VAGSTQPLRSCIRGSAQPRTPDSTANLVFSQPTSLRRSECGQCTSCTGHPHGYNNTASALEDRNNSSPSTHTVFQCLGPFCILTGYEPGVSSYCTTLASSHCTILASSHCITLASSYCTTLASSHCTILASSHLYHLASSHLLHSVQIIIHCNTQV